MSHGTAAQGFFFKGLIQPNATIKDGPGALVN